MSSIYVVDSSFRRTQIKITPGKYLREVLEEACSSRKLLPEEYMLKTQNNRPVELSQPFRLSGLSAGAKLQLVQASRSPSVVSVALQLPEEQGSTRLSDKFASNTSLWTVLRRFEEGVAGQGGSKSNITQQGLPSSNTGAGRLLYRQPCLNAMGRTLDTFADLQKTLGQLGFSNGSVLMRLSYKDTDIPLEQAMIQMSTYFEPDVSSTPTAPLIDVAAESSENTEAMDITLTEHNTNTLDEAVSIDTQLSPQSHSTKEMTLAQPSQPQDTHSSSSHEAETPTRTTNDIAVYLPPSSDTPAAALHEDHDSAFEPGVDDVRALQAVLQKASRNTRLLSDKELEEQEAERQAKLVNVSTVDVRVRYPDQSMIETTIHASDSAADLYRKARNTLKHSTEQFELRYVGARGHQTLSDDPSKKLVKDFSFRGKMLVTLVWSPSASDIARTSPALKDELRTQAQELKVELNKQVQEVADSSKPSEKQAGDTQKSGKAGKGDLEAKMKKFLGFGRK